MQYVLSENTNEKLVDCIGNMNVTDMRMNVLSRAETGI